MLSDRGVGRSWSLRTWKISIHLWFERRQTVGNLLKRVSKKGSLKSDYDIKDINADSWRRRVVWEGHFSRGKAGKSHHQWPSVEELCLWVLHLANLVKRSCFQLVIFSVYCIGSLQWWLSSTGANHSLRNLELHIFSGYCDPFYTVKPTRPLFIGFFFVFFFLASGIAVLIPWPGIEPVPPAVEAWRINHWTSRELPNYLFLRLHLSRLKKGNIMSMHFYVPWSKFTPSA